MDMACHSAGLREARQEVLEPQGGEERENTFFARVRLFARLVVWHHPLFAFMPALAARDALVGLLR